MPTPTPAPIGALQTIVMTEVVNNEGRLHSFLTDLLFPEATHRVLDTNTVQVDQMTYTPVMAPFVKVNGAAVMLPGSTGSSYTVKTPHISLKKPFTGSEKLLQRRAGESDVLIDGGRSGRLLANMNQDIADDMKVMSDAIDERVEWMVSRGLIGTISYSAVDRDNFTITFAKPAANTVVPAVFWDAADPTPHQDIVGVKRVQSAAQGPSLTDGICSEAASDALMSMVEAEKLKLSTQRRVATGSFEAFVNDYSEEGVLYLGRISGIDFWEYSQSVVDEAGTETLLIRAGYIEFVSRTNKAQNERRMYYGVHVDAVAIREGLEMGKVFAKSWLQDDPSVYIQNQQSNPLPVNRHPDWNVSFQATDES